MGFGPELPHAVFSTGDVTPVMSFMSSETDPKEVAAQFAAQLTSNARSAGSSFYVRDDSYTDKNSGITHVYIRQLLYGVEVADGDINVNVKDGRVLSYGDSFYRGDIVEPLEVDVHADHCSELESELQYRFDRMRQESLNDDQYVLTGGIKPNVMGDLPFLLEWNCRHVYTPYAMVEEGNFEEADFSTDPSAAIVQFMIAATPDEDLSEALIDNAQDFISNMQVTPVASLQGDGRVSHQSTVDNVPGAVSPVKVRMAFVQVPHGESTAVELVWKLEVEMEDNWYEAAVTNKAPHRIVSVIDWASDSPMPLAPVPKDPEDRPGATYNVFAWGINDPAEGNRTLEKENFDSLASPVGWHSLPVVNDPNSVAGSKDKTAFVNTTTTWGNNVFAHENWEGQNSWQNNYRPDAGASLVFDFKYNPKVTEKSDALDEAKKYINATVTQLFYTSNLVHDLYYRYGFDEVSGNFQQHNFGRGGKENDAVIANAQDGSGFNNANFMTPPDGQNGRCRMYLWNTAIPYRDGDLEAGIVIHELSHGLSTRLTGGPANSGCLGWGESGGMGEGWGDFLATTIRSSKTYSDYPMGAWAANRPTGIRNFVYSLNDTVNPSTYKTLDKPGYWGVHAIGEVWAEILWVVSNRLIAKHGFSESLFPPTPDADGNVPEGDFYRPAQVTVFGEKKPLVPKHGNSLVVQLVLDGMKLQPCRPSFFDARDAIIAADKALTGGENYCDLWLGFAERGLGPDARVDGRTPWGGGVRTDVSWAISVEKHTALIGRSQDFDAPSACQPEKAPKPTPGDGDDDDDEPEDWFL
ncbi:hypothetical protein PHLCEN_2v12769 [Hermanssonia centrifuga]|uniref:Extracellular metalloproteinase n=1 Tax=Hermanssonia centrifuga TaxID=98765 RepID=A0A2R6NG46_9APHY|nr:hypothetical protein PHLCEN_2v12769 [Hermanssonia centrifuga]